MIENGADAAPVEDPNSSVVGFVKEEVVVYGSPDKLAVVLEIRTSSEFVVVSKLRCDSSDEDPNPSAVVLDDELEPIVLIISNCSISKTNCCGIMKFSGKKLPMLHYKTAKFQVASIFSLRFIQGAEIGIHP